MVDFQVLESYRKFHQKYNKTKQSKKKTQNQVATMNAPPMT